MYCILFALTAMLINVCDTMLLMGRSITGGNWSNTQTVNRSVLQTADQNCGESVNTCINLTKLLPTNHGHFIDEILHSCEWLLHHKQLCLVRPCFCICLFVGWFVCRSFTAYCAYAIVSFHCLGHCNLVSRLHMCLPTKKTVPCIASETTTSALYWPEQYPWQSVRLIKNTEVLY